MVDSLTTSLETTLKELWEGALEPKSKAHPEFVLFPSCRPLPRKVLGTKNPS